MPVSRQAACILAVLIVILVIGPADGADPPATETPVDISSLILADWIDRDLRFQADKPAEEGAGEGDSKEEK